MNGRFNLSAWALEHRSLVAFAMLALLVAGTFSYLRLGRAEDPPFTIKTMVVHVEWPGASAEEMQRQVTDRIEKTLQEIPWFDYAESYSTPGATTILVNLRDATPPGEVPGIWYQVRKKVGDMAPSLPQGVIGPFFDDEFGDTFGNIFAVSGDGYTMAELKHHLEAIRQDLLRVPNVAKVDMVGVQPEEIRVEVSHRHLASLGLSAAMLAESLGRQNAVTASGAADTATDRVHLRISGALEGVEAIAAVPVEANGRILRLGDIATVVRGYQDPPTSLMRRRGEPVLGLAVSMQPGGNILDLGRDLDAAVGRIQSALPIGIDISKIADQPAVVRYAVDEFLLKLAIALGIVLLVSFASLGLRTGLVVALSVPLVLAITFMVMDWMGIGLQRISLGALIISLGLLVDDAIIAVEMMVVKMEEGWDRLRAASYAWTATAFPMLSGTLITAAGFVPVGFASSKAGEYTGSIFWVVTTALLVSWVVAVVFTPWLGVKLLPDYAKGGAHHDVHDTRALRALRRVVTGCVRFRWPVILVTVGLFAAAVSAMGVVQKQFFPSSSRPEILVDLTLPEGSSFEATDAQVRRLERLLAAEPLVADVATFVGSGTPRFYLPLDPVLPRRNFAQALVITKGSQQAAELLTKLRAELDTAFPDLRVRVQRLENGPPVGYPVQFRVLGPDPDGVRRIAEQVRGAVRQDPNTRDVHLDWRERSRAARIEVDQDKARLLGLSTAEIATTLQTLYSGRSVTEVREGIELIDVRLRAVSEERNGVGDLDSVMLRTATGRSVPLGQVARVTYGLEEGIVWRRNRDLMVRVRADVEGRIQPAEVTARIEAALRGVKASLPSGYRIETGGMVEEAAKGEQSIIGMLPVVGFIVAALLMAQLQSFSKAILVLLTAPLGIIGVAFSLLVFDVPLGFVSILGIIALAGMIMRNSVILVDQIDQDVRAGHHPYDAVIDATVRRARPIVLTALAAVLAFIPLTTSDFWGPMAIAISGGLTVATILTLLFIPALYAAWFRIGQPVRRPERGEPRGRVAAHHA